MRDETQRDLETETEKAILGKVRYDENKPHLQANNTIYYAASIVAILVITLAASLLILNQDISFDSLELTVDRRISKALTRARIYAQVLSINPQIITGNPTEHSVDTAPAPEKVISCYYNTPEPNNINQLFPQNVHPFLCTHINVAFARVENKEIYLDANQNKTIGDLVKLKQINHKLKILLSIGGAGGDDGFSKMVVNHASRKTFIKSIKRVLRTFNLDGVDLDWEFPAIHSLSESSGKRERQHFSQLLREIKAEYEREKRNYLLTVAVAAPQPIVDASYDVDQLNMYTDYVNLMTYDFHSFTKFSPFTGLNSPLYARPMEHWYMGTLNINYTVQMYLNKGLDKNKIVVGIPTYGHTFTLMNEDNTLIGSPAAGFGSLGYRGFINYPEVCTFLKTYKSEVSIVIDGDAKVPYFYRHQEWVSYDTPESVREKAKFILDNGLRGAMMYSLNADDYDGVCKGDFGKNMKFPLSETVRNNLVNRNSTK